MAFPTRHVLAVASGSSAVNTQGMHGGSERIDRVRLQSLEPYRQRIDAFVGQGGKTENEVVRYMKSLGMEQLTNAGFRFRGMLVLLGYTVGEGRGSSTALVRKVADAAAPMPAAAAPQELGPRRIVGKQRPTLAPAEAAANLRRRIVGKRPPA